MEVPLITVRASGALIYFGLDSLGLALFRLPRDGLAFSAVQPGTVSNFLAGFERVGIRLSPP